MPQYMVCSENGYALTDGLQDHEAREVAQRIANSRGESVWLSAHGSDESEEFEPDTAVETCQTGAGDQARQGSEDAMTNEEIMRAMAEADFEEWRWQNGDDEDAMESTYPRDGWQNFLSGYTVEFWRSNFEERGGSVADDDEAEALFAEFKSVADDVFAAAE